MELEDYLNYKVYPRDYWKKLHYNLDSSLTNEELEKIKSLNDQIDQDDVTEVYLPLINLIHIYMKACEVMEFSKSLFLHEDLRARPFIIGVSGSVAVGKSTTSRLLQLLLSRQFPELSVDLVTTDGFLYPNEVLTEKGILHRKGFPESYDMGLLHHFLNAVKNRQTVEIPVYSHQRYNIIPDEKQVIKDCDIMIVEGINVLQTTENADLFITDYFDFSIYIDAAIEDIEYWYLERFKTLLELAKTDKDNHYHQYVDRPMEVNIAMAKRIWQEVNLVNLEEYIAPTKSRADLILNKSKNHLIDKIFVKK